MTDKVQKIKDWISKEQDGLMDAQGNFEYPEHEGAYHILCNLDTFIDSFQEEPVSKELEKELDSYIKDNFTIDKEQLDRFGLDEKDYMYSMDKSDMLAMVRHFTELQHKKDVVITKDLIATAFANGMADMRQQLLKNAIEREVLIDAGGYPYVDYNIELYDYDKDIPLAKKGDKVKIVVIKEEESV